MSTLLSAKCIKNESKGVPKVFNKLMGAGYWEMIESDKIVLRKWLMVLSMTMCELHYKFRYSLKDVIEKHDLEYDLLESCTLLSDALGEKDDEDWLTHLDIFDDRAYDMKEELTESSLLGLSEWCVDRLQLLTHST